MNYHIARNGQQSSGLTELDIRNRLQNGQLSPDDLCWTEGMPEWQPVRAVFPPSNGGLSLSKSPASPVNPYAPPLSESLRPRSSMNAPLAGLGQRLGAAMLDSLIVFISVLPFMFGAQMIEQAEMTGSQPPMAGLALMGLGGLLLLALIVYTLVLLSTKGQSLGKKMLGIRIVNYHDDGNPGFVKAVLLRVIVNGVLGMIPLYSLIDICVIFGQERRCIHDQIASTRVVQC